MKKGYAMNINSMTRVNNMETFQESATRFCAISEINQQNINKTSLRRIQNSDVELYSPMRVDKQSSLSLIDNKLSSVSPMPLN